MAALYVIDASAAIKAFVAEDHSEQARALLAGTSVLLAPVHALGECAETLVRKADARELSSRQVLEALESLKASIGFVSIDGLIGGAAAIAMEAKVSVYDALYVEAARLLDCKLVTADARLLRKLSSTAHGRLLMQLKEFQP